MSDVPLKHRGSRTFSLASGWFLPVVLLACGCGSTMAADADDSGDGGPIDPPSGMPEPESVAIRFEPEGAALHLRPRERIRVTVVMAPPAAHTVRLALLSARDTTHDAVLSASQVVSDTSGRAEVELVGPSAPTTSLSLRAQVGSSASEIPIVVEAGGEVKLEVQASYTGRRTVTEWVIGVHRGRTCDSFGTELPPDGERPARVAPDETAFIEGNQAAPDLSITVRAGEFASGCVTLNGEVAVDNPVLVPVHDRPLRLENTALDVAFQLEPDDAAFRAALDSGLELVETAFRDGRANDVEALLDAMEAGLELGATFTTSREAARWDTALVTSVFSGDALRLSRAIRAWNRVGRAALLSPRAFEGRLQPDADDPSSGQLEIQRVGELAASLVDFAVESSQWDVDAADTLVFGGEFSWAQSELVAGLALGPAIAETGATDVPAALGAVASCTNVAAALRASSTEFARACGLACAQAACGEALAAMWERARRASGEARTRLALAVTGRAVVGELAQATSLDGSWVGRLSVDGEESDTRGVAVGFEPKYGAR